MLRLINSVPDELEAALDAAGAAGLLEGAELEELDELEHAATSSTAAANPVAPHIFRIASLLTPCRSPIGYHGSRAVPFTLGDVAADEAAYGERHRDSDSAQNKLAQAGTEQRAAGEPACQHAARQELRRCGAEGGR
jgi:hypothetical protein